MNNNPWPAIRDWWRASWLRWMVFGKTCHCGRYRLMGWDMDVRGIRHSLETECYYIDTRGEE